MNAVVERAGMAAPSGTDNVSTAKAALRRIEQLTQEIGKSEKVKLCRATWIEYGKPLVAQRDVMPSTQEFGHWVTENKLDTGVAKNAVTRSDAMWMARHEHELSELKALRNHHPSALRQELRDAGYTWATSTAGEQGGEQAKKSDTEKVTASWPAAPKRGRAVTKLKSAPSATTAFQAERRGKDAGADTNHQQASHDDTGTQTSCEPRLTREEYELLLQAVNPESIPDKGLLTRAQAIVKKLEKLVLRQERVH